MADHEMLRGAAEAASLAAEIAGLGTPDVPLTGRQKIRLFTLVILKRLRFFAILAAVGLFICKWDLLLNYWEKWTQPRSRADLALDAGHEFYCPMDPQVVRATYEPNGDVPKCPICGMPLSIRAQGEKASLPPGITARVQFSPERVQLAGIQTVPVAWRPVARRTQTVGYVAYDESRLSRIVSRVDGYVEKLYLDRTFAVVRQGDPLAEIYSPELYSAARELLLASKSAALADLAAAARNKLLLLGVAQQEIERIVASGEPSSRLVIRSPQSGYVVEKKVVAGASVDARMTLFEVADLSQVWVEAEVYEKDIRLLAVGQPVEATVEAYPQRKFTGRLAAIYPRVETATRTNRIRCELDNPGHELRPGMFATVDVNTPLESVEPYKSLAATQNHVRLASLSSPPSTPQAEFLVVPQRAVVDTGAKQVVYVEREPGLFEGREVELGPRDGDNYPVLRGLQPGERVAAAGGFLIDAETRLNPAAAATYFGASGGPQQAAPPATHPADKPADKPAPPRRIAELTAEQRKNIEQLPPADRQLALQQALCPVTDGPLGGMGVPIKVMLRDQPVFLCCKGCLGKAKRNPEEMLKRVAEYRAAKRG